MTIIGRRLVLALGSFSVGLVLFAAVPALAVCESLPDHQALRSALTEAVAAAGGPSSGRLDLHLSATTMDRHGTVCAVDMSVAYGGAPAEDGAAGKSLGDPTAGQQRIGAAAILGTGGSPIGGERIAVGTGFAASGHIRKDPPLTAGQLTALRRRALKQAF